MVDSDSNKRVLSIIRIEKSNTVEWQIIKCVHFIVKTHGKFVWTRNFEMFDPRLKNTICDYSQFIAIVILYPTC